MLTKELVESLSSDDITRKEYNRILELISERVNEIWRFICAESKRKLEWWAFRNDRSLGHGNGSTGGEFDPDEDMDFIEIIGENSTSRNNFYSMNEGFITELLWDEDYKTTVREIIARDNQAEKDDKEKKKNKNTEKKQKKEEIIASIQAKLTPEELKFITFK